MKIGEQMESEDAEAVALPWFNVSALKYDPEKAVPMFVRLFRNQTVRAEMAVKHGVN